MDGQNGNGESGASSIGGGRYELRERHAESAGVEFWYGYDTRVRRDVAITVIPRNVSDPYTVKSRIGLVQRLESPAIARVLDVLGTRDVSYVVAERRPVAPSFDTRTEREVAATVLPLAAAAEEAHRNGVTLSIDDRDRLQIDDTGAAFIAFPAPALHHDPAADIHGLGRLLSRLLTAVPAGPGHDELATLTTRASNGAVATAGALVQVLERIGSGTAAPTTPMVTPPTPAPRGILAGLDAATKRKLAFGAAAAAAVLLIAFLAALFIADDSDFPTKNVNSVTTSVATTTPAPSSTTTPATSPAVTSTTTTTVAPLPSTQPAPPVTVQPTVVPPPPPATTVAPTPNVPGTVPCYPGYNRQPDGQCLPGGATTIQQNPAPVQPQQPSALPCYPGYSRQPDGQCLPSR